MDSTNKSTPIWERDKGRGKEEDGFYQQLQAVQERLSKDDISIAMGDLNAKLGGARTPPPNSRDVETRYWRP